MPFIRSDVTFFFDAKQAVNQINLSIRLQKEYIETQNRVDNLLEKKWEIVKW